MAKRDFGSFHASNVQELLSLPNEKYFPPQVPFSLPSIILDDHKNSHGSLIFGREIKKRFFLLEDSCCFLNHGAFGAALKPGLDTARQWQLYAEQQPLRFYDREVMPFLVHVSRRMAHFVNCCPTDLALVHNATFGINSVLNSLDWVAGDVILTFNITYGAVKKLVKHICSKTGAINREAEIQFPISGKEEARVLIDGAHALGSLPLDLKSLNPDYYVSNCHKWFCSPKGAAFLYVRPDLQHEVRPAVVSHGLGSGFNSEFVWTGLDDYSSFLALHTVLDFWEAFTPSAIRTYIHQLMRDATDVLTKLWDTKLPAPLQMFGSMALVELPKSIHQMFETVDYSAAETVQNTLYHDFSIEVPIKSLQDRLYVRISVHIHNQLSDYEKLGRAMITISQKRKHNGE
ncbi:isopenicillin N epimerase [Elysia marginata]|uniref:Isopenicillin N epimerase n=1 Tax=Elysia marginata TaxID=1093978 RepID=A0AAV4JJ91_9GAST|nr:isopenicillin N epimerase [Elysia marginata]